MALGGQPAEKVGTATPLPGDYHVHTAFSDGEGEPEQCVERALALGLPEIGITDHLVPSSLDADGDFSVAPARMEAYVRAVRDVALRYPAPRVLLGVEADYVPGTEDELAETLAAWPFDYVIGAVHCVDGFSFDDPRNRDDERWMDRDASVYMRYYELIRGAAACGLFDVIAHLDYITLWGHDVPCDISAAEAETLRAIAAAGVAIEVNTTGAMDPAGRMYPAPGLLARAWALDIPAVFASDAHEVRDVGWSFEQAVTLARGAGYQSSLQLSTRTLEPLC